MSSVDFLSRVEHNQENRSQLAQLAGPGAVVGQQIGSYLSSSLHPRRTDLFLSLKLQLSRTFELAFCKRVSEVRNRVAPLWVVRLGMVREDVRRARECREFLQDSCLTSTIVIFSTW